MAEDLLDLTLKISFEAKIKLSYYILGLTAAILALSIQFIIPLKTDLYPHLVFFAWVLLIFSLLAGIWWQKLWIDWVEGIHSGLLKLRGTKDKKKPKDINNDRNINTLNTKLWMAESSQLLLLVLGLSTLVLFKIINFYFR